MDIVFLEPENAQNVGSVCRAMKNFGFKNLVLVNPKCDHKSLDAIKLAKHAGDILKKAKIMKNIDEIIKKYDTLVATSAIVGSDFNIPRSPLKPEEFADLAKGKKSIALVLGRESEGMSNEEIKKCDFMVTIPASDKYGTLNVSHAAAILLYEIYKKGDEKTAVDKILPIKRAMKEELLKLIYKKIDSFKFSTQEKVDTQKKLWKKIIGKSFVTRREAMAMFGFFKKIK